MVNYRNNMKRILVVGSWAKEEITIENLKKNPDLEVFSFLDTRNPGILERADGIRIGSLYEVESILDYAREMNIDLVLVTTAAPLAAGLVDLLEKEKIPVFGPNREAARLESDKAFTRELMKKYYPEAIPGFKVCETTEDAVAYAKELKWQVAIKPIGLTDGLGVKVFGVQLNSEKEVEDYIREINTNRISGNSRVIVEEKMEGEEFTIQCFVYRDTFIPTPAVQDFKKLLNGEKGPNTASMGSYSDSGRLLPFMNRADYLQAVRIIKETLAGFKKETDQWCCGFLYGQFMLCKDGIKLVEYNFRPGDPEWMNTVITLKDNIADIIGALMQGKNPQPRFQRKATVCKYIVPPAYPYRLNETLEVSLDKDKIDGLDTSVYWSCGLDENGKLNVGSERGLAFLAYGDTIVEANKKIEAALDAVQGDFYYRSDIGTPELTRSKVQTVNQLLGAEFRVRTAKETDFLDVYEFVSGCPPLENYAEHVYKILLRYCGNSCFIAEMRNRIVGFVLGLISQTHSQRTYFLWQIGVSPSMQGTGLGKRLLKEVEKQVTKLGCQRIELTIDPENIPSQKLFAEMEYCNISRNEGETLEVMGHMAVKDYYKPGRHFMLYEKILPGGEKPNHNGE
jgi:phosphoribosylamine--glycine ligase